MYFYQQEHCIVVQRQCQGFLLYLWLLKMLVHSRLVEVWSHVLQVHTTSLRFSTNCGDRPKDFSLTAGCICGNLLMVKLLSSPELRNMPISHFSIQRERRRSGAKLVDLL